MPALHLKKVWTPLGLFGISIFKCLETGGYYYKVKGQKVKRLKMGKASV
ncbi:hypothetical protein [Bacillus sp. OTU530]